MTILSEVEDYLQRTGVKAYRLGVDSCGDPCMVSRLRAGRSMRPETERRLRDYMAGRIGPHVRTGAKDKSDTLDRFAELLSEHDLETGDVGGDAEKCGRAMGFTPGYGRKMLSKLRAKMGAQAV